MILSSEASPGWLPSVEEQVSGCSPEELVNLEALLDEEEAKRSQLERVY